MTIEDHKVAYGYLSSFKGQPTILFAGDEQALCGFADFLANVANRPLNVTMMLDVEECFVSKRGTRLTLTVVADGLGMRRMNSSSPEPPFEWRIAKELAMQFAELTRVVANADRPSHQYLDAQDDEVTVVVSKGEYSNDWLQGR
jgi:hypothetical protein